VMSIDPSARRRISVLLVCIWRLLGFPWSRGGPGSAVAA